MPSAVLTLSPEQKQAQDAILQFVKEKRSELRIGGFAGTGKTFLIANTLNLLRDMNENKVIAMACFTGKAAYVLREKLAMAGALEDEYVGTIHGLMYKPIVKEGVILGWKRVDRIEADLIIIDEASMVNEAIYNDLKPYNVPMLFIGDHGQLPPIGGQLALMQKPDITLTKIQRQAAENPIIQLSAEIRETGKIPEGSKVHNGMGWQKMSMRLHDLVKQTGDPGEVMFLCGYNKTRVFLNGAIRDRLGFSKQTPEQGEKLICLKNNREIGIFNGMGGLLKKIKWYDEVDEFHCDVEVEMEDDTIFKGRCVQAQFGASQTLRELDKLDPRQLRELFDWGYALTVHKAQGSEADRVVLVEERFSQMDDETWRRWLYTGITRARKQLTVISRIR
jgi:exodeoxyribonuclease-5